VKGNCLGHLRKLQKSPAETPRGFKTLWVCARPVNELFSGRHRPSSNLSAKGRGVRLPPPGRGRAGVRVNAANCQFLVLPAETLWVFTTLRVCARCEFGGQKYRPRDGLDGEGQARHTHAVFLILPKIQSCNTSGSTAKSRGPSPALCLLRFVFCNTVFRFREGICKSFQIGPKKHSIEASSEAYPL
jgi:hypothetical protein